MKTAISGVVFIALTFCELAVAQEPPMVRVQGGTFMMGCTPEQHKCLFEKPAHRVTVSNFEIGKYEVTQDLWKKVMGRNPSTFNDCSQCPVETVSWDDIHLFLKKLNGLTKKKYRLPTEAEWEYAARGGLQSQKHRYPGSDDEDLSSVAWYFPNSDKRTHPVGQKLSNELGIHDMGGNVWEWVQDCWHDDYHGAPDDGHAWEEEGCDLRVARGGFFDHEAGNLRSASRIWNKPSVRNVGSGFRIARTIP